MTDSQSGSLDVKIRKGFCGYAPKSVESLENEKEFQEQTQPSHNPTTYGHYGLYPVQPDDDGDFQLSITCDIKQDGDKVHRISFWMTNEDAVRLEDVLERGIGIGRRVTTVYNNHIYLRTGPKIAGELTLAEQQITFSLPETDHMKELKEAVSEFLEYHVDEDELESMRKEFGREAANDGGNEQ